MNRLVIFKARRNGLEYVVYTNDNRQSYVAIDPVSKLWSQRPTINEALDVLLGPKPSATAEEGPAAASKQPQRPRGKK